MEKFMPVRELLRNYKQVVMSKDTIIITKNGKPESVLIPYSEWEKGVPKPRTSKKGVRMGDIIHKYTFTSDDPYLSEKVDEILYQEPYE